MSQFRYDIFYKTPLPLNEDWRTYQWDIFVSAYNSSERVRLVFDKVTAARKYWLMHQEYQYSVSEYPTGVTFQSHTDNEADFIKELVDRIEQDSQTSIS